MAKELDFHLLELARAERKVAGCDFVAKTLTNLGDTKRNSLPGCESTDVLEVDEDSLGSLRAQERRVLFRSPASAPTVVGNIRLKSRGSVRVPRFLARRARAAEDVCSKSGNKRMVRSHLKHFNIVDEVLPNAFLKSLEEAL